jgi:hypothetical protein
MFDQLFAGLATGFSEAFGGPFIAATANWPGTPLKDAGGSIATPGTPVNLPCRVQFDRTTEAMRRAEGFLETDVRILVLAASLSADLDTAATIVVTDGDWTGSWTLLSCELDPARVGYECRGRRV